MRLLCALAVIMALSLSAACSEDDASSKSSTGQASESEAVAQRTLPELYEHFQKFGLVIERKDPKHGGLIGATSGKSLRIGDASVEVYQYNLSIESGKKALTRLKKRGVMGKAPVVNGNLVLLDKPDHPQWKEIKAAFLAMK
jgi:predicted sugar kinase